MVLGWGDVYGLFDEYVGGGGGYGCLVVLVVVFGLFGGEWEVVWE